MIININALIKFPTLSHLYYEHFYFLLVCAFSLRGSLAVPMAIKVTYGVLVWFCSSVQLDNFRILHLRQRDGLMSMS